MTPTRARRGEVRALPKSSHVGSNRRDHPEVQPENAFFWHAHARTARSAAERKAAHERVVALCVPEVVDFVDDLKKGESFMDARRQKCAALRRIRDEAIARLAQA